MEDERGTGHDAPQSASAASPSAVTLAEHHSDSHFSPPAVPHTVMAEQVTNDVVKEAQSVGPSAPIDDTASATNTSAASGEQPSGPATTDSKSINSPPAPTNATTATTDSASASAADAKASANGDGPAASVSLEVGTVWVFTKHHRPRIT